jgi:hypothetical protein
MPNAGRIGNRLEAASGAPGQHMVLDCMERYIMARKNARNPLWAKLISKGLRSTAACRSGDAGLSLTTE